MPRVFAAGVVPGSPCPVLHSCSPLFGPWKNRLKSTPWLHEGRPEKVLRFGDQHATALSTKHGMPGAEYGVADVEWPKPSILAVGQGLVVLRLFGSRLVRQELAVLGHFEADAGALRQGSVMLTLLVAANGGSTATAKGNTIDRAGHGSGDEARHKADKAQADCLCGR